MERKWIKWIGITLLIPIILVVLLVILIYIPPVQNYLQRRATDYLSQMTGMQISIDRIHLRFPLDLQATGVQVIQAPDTLLTLESLGAKVKLIPLFRSEIELTGVELNNGVVNTAGLINGMQLRGTLGQFTLESRVINLSTQLVDLDIAELRDADLHLLMTEAEETPQDTVQSALNWRVLLSTLNIDNVQFAMDMPADTLSAATRISRAEARDIEVDLGSQLYALQNLLINGNYLNYNSGTSTPVQGFDPSHIALRDVRIGLDSVSMRGMEIGAVISELSMNERSGLSITSLTGSVYADTVMIRVPQLQLRTPHSALNFRAQADLSEINRAVSHIDANLNANIGKQDVMLFAGGLSESFWRDYPFRPLIIQMGAAGNMDTIQISRLSADLPGAFTLSGSGQIRHITDSINRGGDVELQMRTQQLNFLLGLAGMPNDGSIVIPPGITMNANLGLQGPQVTARLRARESVGTVNLDGTYNMNTEAYRANVAIDSIQVNHFMPRDSIYSVTASASVTGRGINFTSPRTTASITAAVDRVQYGSYDVSGINLTGQLRNGVASANFTSNNELLVMEGSGTYRLNTRYMDATLNANVSRLQLSEFGISSPPLPQPVSFTLSAIVQRDSVGVSVASGDMFLDLRSGSPIQQLISESTAFSNVLTRQIDQRRLDHNELRNSLPSASLFFQAGLNNPLTQYISTQGIGYTHVDAGFIVTPEIGINGRARVHRLRVDTLQLDTISLAISQDTARIALRGGVINGPGNPHVDFTATMDGEIRSEDAELTFNYFNAQGENGLTLGVNVTPQPDGFLFRLIPESPVVAFRPFSFNGHNEVFIRNDGRVTADVQMLTTDGTGLIVQSTPDEEALQNLSIELRRIELGEISRMLPYYPSFGGLLSAEASFRQTTETMQVSAEANIDDLLYENKIIGNLGLGATWLPGTGGLNYINAYVSADGQQILTADGTFQGGADGGLDVDAMLEHLPLHLAEAFIPNDIVTLSGDLDGQLHIAGNPSTPLINGELSLDSVVITSPQYGVSLRFDTRPLQINNSILTFNEFAIHATGANPFVIGGTVNFQDFAQATADLTLTAQNFTLLDAPRTSTSMLYGTVVFDLNTTIRGPITEMVMRGNLNLLSDTDVTYVLTDSPLTVQDRLGDMVEFVSFADTLLLANQAPQASSFSGFDIAVNINIEPLTEVGVDLNPSRSNYIELEGGGNLSFQYTPQGDMSLTGRYTLSGGTVRYSLPTISVKEFGVTEGSYVEFLGDPMEPHINFRASEQMSISVPQQGSVLFNVYIEARNTLSDLDIVFNLEAPENPEIQDELNAMDAQERSKQAFIMMARGIYFARSSGVGGDGFDLPTLLGNFIRSQGVGLAGSLLQNFNVTFGSESYDDPSGASRTDYNFQFSQRFFNDRVQVIIGGRVSTGQDTEDVNSFIDNVALEYRLDRSGTRYINLYHNTNYENRFEGEVVETGVGVVLRRRVNRLGELFIFGRRRQPQPEPEPETQSESQPQPQPATVPVAEPQQ